MFLDLFGVAIRKHRTTFSRKVQHANKLVTRSSSHKLEVNLDFNDENTRKNHAKCKYTKFLKIADYTKSPAIYSHFPVTVSHGQPFPLILSHFQLLPAIADKGELLFISVELVK